MQNVIGLVGETEIIQYRLSQKSTLLSNCSTGGGATVMSRLGDFLTSCRKNHPTFWPIIKNRSKSFILGL